MKKLHKRLLKGLGANAFGQVATIIIQLVSVPIFLQAWGVELYGEWLILSTLPSYFAMSDIGFANVAANEMTMEVARNNKDKALEVFQSTWVFISLVCFLLFIVLAGTAWFLPIEHWLNIQKQSHLQTVFIVLALTFHVLLKLQGGMLSAGFRCEGNYALGILIGNSIRFIENISIVLVVLAGGSLVNAAVTFLICQFLGLLYMKHILQKSSPWITYRLSHVRALTIKLLAKPALAFMGYPLGQALNNQGMITVVAVTLDPTAVVTFSTLRTISRLAFQAMGMINNTIWPEVSAAYGADNLDLARKLHHRSCQVSIWLSSLIVLCLTISGETILDIWTKGNVDMHKSVFNIFLVVIIANSLWLTSSVVPNATNQHQKTALFFLLGTGISVLTASLLAPHFGLFGAAVSVLFTDIIMTIHVLSTSLRLLQDSFPRFLRVIVTPPNLNLLLNT